MGERLNLVVIGAGPGGYEAAIEAAKKGMKVALVENRELGGTCLNRGCIPTKTLLHTADLYHELQSGPSIGLEVTGAAVDMKVLQSRKCQVVEQLQKGIASLMKMNQISVFYGTGSIPDRNTVKVTPLKEEGQPVFLETDNILIATGSVPSIPPIPGSGLPGVVTSDELLDKKELFHHLIIIGGGVIGMEFASVYSSLGSSVTVVEAMDRILPGMDKEISQNLKMILKKRKVEIHTGAKVEEITLAENGSGLICRYTEKDQTCEAAGDGILIATGRKAYTEGLITEESSPEIQAMAMERGRIVTDENYETSVPGIYGVGDVTGGIQLAHAAIAQGRSAVAHMAARGKHQEAAGTASREADGTAGQPLSGPSLLKEIRTDVIPSCVYTSPEIGCAGMSADEAKEKGIPVITKKYVMSANGKSLLSQQERGFIKVVAHSESHQILGAQMMCARATDMISQFGAAIVSGLTLEDMARVIFPHPTFSEGISEAVRE